MTSYAEVFAGVYATVAAHAQHQDAGNTDGIMALYTPDAVLEVPGMGVYEGADVIRAAWDDWKPKGLQRHMPVNIVITDWDEEEARATTDVVFLAPVDARMRFSIAVTSAACSWESPGRPNAAWLSASVASSASVRPAAVMVASTTRRSSGDICRWTRPRCSSRAMALVTAAGWTISRTPILPIGSEPDRLKASSRSAS